MASLLLDKRADIRRARFLWSFSYALQIPQELIHRSNGRRYHSVVVLTAYQVLPESIHNRRRARPRWPFPLLQPQNYVNSSAHHTIPMRRLRDSSWVVPFGER